MGDGGAYLLLGKRAPVENYLAFVRASQRKDGHIPLASMPADTKPGGMDDYGRGLRWPEDVYCYGGRKWIGLFQHWQIQVNPLSVLAPICLILTHNELGDREHLDSIELAGKYVLSRRTPVSVRNPLEF